MLENLDPIHTFPRKSLNSAHFTVFNKIGDTYDLGHKTSLPDEMFLLGGCNLPVYSFSEI
jgi:hypothetical protein